MKKKSVSVLIKNELLQVSMMKNPGEEAGSEADDEIGAFTGDGGADSGVSDKEAVLDVDEEASSGDGD